MKYFEDDDEYMIKSRIKRCITRAKRGPWKKADAALIDAALIDLNINDDWNKTQSRCTTSPAIKRTLPKPSD